MLRNHNYLILTVMLVLDATVLAGLWMVAYTLYLNTPMGPFFAGLFGRQMLLEPFPDTWLYFSAMPVVTLLTMLVYHQFRLYVPRRADQRWREVAEITRANVMAIIVLVFLSFFYREKSFSRGVVILYAALSTFGMTINRALIRSLLRKLRRRGLNQRHILIIGCGSLGRAFLDRVQRNPWTGFKVVGFVDESGEHVPGEIQDLPVLGTIEHLRGILKAHPNLDQLYVTLPYDRGDILKKVFAQLDESPLDIRLIPDIVSFETLRTDVTDFDGLPIISMRGTPLVGWGVMVKRLFDMAFSLLVLILLSPLLLVISLLVKLTSPGPIFYGQVRMGLDGRVFAMWKFRSMRQDAEAKSGAVMASRDPKTGRDPRATPIGHWLRKTNIDELPQFYNVLMGQMSVVGPRPERPELIENFKTSIPRYMLRHRVKSGITGWAQVHGLRGSETSLAKRIEYDLFYIENWSFALDLYIIFRTVFTFGKGF